MTPYTPNAVMKIKQAIDDGVPPSLVRAHLGWDSEMFERICRRHAIGLVQSSSADENANVNPRWHAPVVQRPQREKPGRLRGGRINVTIALTRSLLARLDRYATRAGLPHTRASGLIVEEYLREHESGEIVLTRATYYGEGSSKFVKVSLFEETAQVLTAEAMLRPHRTASLGRLVKAIIVRHFESVASR